MLLPLLLAVPLPPPQEDAVPETVVVAPRPEETITTSAAKITVVTAEELERTGERSLPRAIGRAAGIWIQESHLGGGAPVLRGLLGNQVLLVVDGVRVNDSTTRFGPNETLNDIDPSVVERVEIIHGSSSVLYGSDAIGGVIEVWTKRRAPLGPDGGAPRVEATAGGVFDTATDGRRVTLGASGATARHGGLVSFAAKDWGDLEGGDGVHQPHTGYRGNSFFGSWDWVPAPHRTLRLTTLVNRNFDVPRTFQLVAGYGQTEPRYERYDFKLQDRRRTQLTWDDDAPGLLADSRQVRLSLREYTEQRSRRRRGSSIHTFEEYRVRTVGLGADWRRGLGENQLLSWGFDLDHDVVAAHRIDTDTTDGGTTAKPGAFPPGSRYTSFGAFVQDEILRFEPIYLTLGLRWSLFDFHFDDPATGDGVGNRFDAVTASLEAARDIGETTRVTATLAQGFQAPNLEDLGNDGDFAGGTEIANPALDPSRSLMGELALEVDRSIWSGTCAIFGTRITDYIGRRLLDEGDPGVAGDETYLRENAGEVRLYGAELTGRVRLGEPGSPWSLAGNASWVRGRQFDPAIDPNTGKAPLDGVDLRRVPPLNGYLGLLWSAPGPGRGWIEDAGLDWVWAARQNELHPEDIGDPRIDPGGTAGWSVFDLDVGGSIRGRLRWRVGLHNILDQLYRVHGSGVFGPGRSLVLELSAGS